MPSFWDLLPASGWPAQPFIAPFDPTQAAPHSDPDAGSSDLGRNPLVRKLGHSRPVCAAGQHAGREICAARTRDAQAATMAPFSQPAQRARNSDPARHDYPDRAAGGRRVSSAVCGARWRVGATNVTRKFRRTQSSWAAGTIRYVEFVRPPWIIRRSNRGRGEISKSEHQLDHCAGAEWIRIQRRPDPARCKSFACEHRTSSRKICSDGCGGRGPQRPVCTTYRSESLSNSAAIAWIG